MITVAASTLLSERQTLQGALERILQGERRPWREADRGRLGELADRFDLGLFERDAIGLLWVLAFAPHLQRQWGPLTPLSISERFGHPPRVRLASESPARIWRMLQEQPLPDGGSTLALDPLLFAWLEDQSEMDPELVGRIRILEPGIELDSWPVDATIAQLQAGLRDQQRWRVLVASQDPAAAEAFAVAVARGLGLPVMGIETPTHPGEEDRQRAVRIHRQAFLDRVAPFFDAADPAHRPGTDIVPFPVQFLGGDSLPLPFPGVQDLRVELAAPRAPERRQIWLRALPSAAAWPEGHLSQLAHAHEAEIGEILRVAATAPRHAEEAAQRLRACTRNEAVGLAQRLDSDFTWEDLILPPAPLEHLKEIAYEARERSRVWAEPEARRLFPQGRGLVALFAGPPGTGKTMAAQVIAAELGLDLLRVDLSAVLSKWVGETAQHLQKILSARSSRRSVLFFDEADALYGKRVEEVKDAQDRFANMDTSHLMVALEAYDGIVLLATNLKASIDPAFIRRIRHVVDFPRPDAPARREIWKHVVRGLFGPERAEHLDADLARVSTLESTGAQIKNAALSALFTTRRQGLEPGAALLGRALARELAKDGAGLSERDLDAVLGGVK